MYKNLCNKKVTTFTVPITTHYAYLPQSTECIVHYIVIIIISRANRLL